MQKLKKLLLALLFPHPALLVILTPVAAAALVYAFIVPQAHPALIYGSYFLSAYALTILCARLPALWRGVKIVKQNNKYISRYTSDAALRIKLSLYCSVGINTAYTLMQLYLGLMEHSPWYYALTGYYALLGLMRGFLLRHARRDTLGKHRLEELHIYRLCGALLVLMHLALSVMVFYIVWQDQGTRHHPIVTIAMAAYTFFTLTMAIVNAVRYRKYNSPVISATKVVALAAALVSMLSLETAMITAFGTGDQTLFRQIITAASGAAVCTAVLTMASLMIVRSTRQIKEIKGDIHHAA